MAFENKTISQINQLIIDQIEAQTAQTIPLLPKAFIRVLAKVLAGVFIILYKLGGWIFLQLFVSTASFSSFTIFGKKLTPLIEWGRLIGVGDPDNATQAVVDLDLTVLSIGQTLSSGTQFISPLTGLVYITQSSYVLSTNPFTVEVTCVTAGTQGNVEAGDILSIANSIGIIEDDATVNALTTAAIDAESESNYRNRVIDRFQLQPQGGALADYRIWAQDAAGVLQTYIYTGDPCNVLVYVAGVPETYTDRVPDSALLLAVGDVIDYDPETGEATRRPVTAIIDPDNDKTYDNILPVTIITFDIEITDLVIDNQPAIEDSINDSLTQYMLDREPYIRGLSVGQRKDRIDLSNVIRIIDEIVSGNNGVYEAAIIELASVITPKYYLGEGELAKLGTLTINGVVYS